jgi:hypothetical protein
MESLEMQTHLAGLALCRRPGESVACLTAGMIRLIITLVAVGRHGTRLRIERPGRAWRLTLSADETGARLVYGSAITSANPAEPRRDCPRTVLLHAAPGLTMFRLDAPAIPVPVILGVQSAGGRAKMVFNAPRNVVKFLRAELLERAASDASRH